MSQAGRQLVGMSVANEFNATLFNRLAQERFAGTRTKAFLPKKAPVILWQRAVPALATACRAALLASGVLSSHTTNESSLATRVGGPLDDSYLTIQPVSNVGKTANLNDSWSLKRQLAQTERMNRISEAMAQQVAWSNFYRPSTWIGATSPAARPLPSTPSYYRVRSVVRTFMSPEPPPDKEVHQAY
jgi:hypothetical protein